MSERLAQAVALHRAGRLDEAERLYREAVAADPRNGDALQFLGLIALARGDLAGAEAQIRAAIAVNPAAAVYHFNLGPVRKALGDLPGAVTSYRRAIELAPGLVEAQMNLGNALRESGDAAAAIAPLREAVRLRPAAAEAHLNLGGALQDDGRLDEAVASYQSALALNPALAEAHYNLGVAQFRRDELDIALACLRRAVELRPDHAGAWNNLAVVLEAYGDFDGARAALQRGATLDPAGFLDSWRNLLSLTLYDPRPDAAALWAAHAEFGRVMAARVGEKLPAWEGARDPERRLRIGYVSSDFCEHPVARNLEPVLAGRDRARFEVTAYADVAREDAMTARLRGLVDAWRDVRGLSDAALARQIRADGIDILVLLAGRFDKNRPQAACWRAAPVQVSFHDPATSGLAEMDYLIADPVLAPRNGPERFAERVARLPSFYIHAPLDDAPDPGPPPGAARGYVTFGSFNNPAKLNDAVLAIWGEVLRAVPGARLALKFKNWFGNEGLRRRMLDRLGVDPGRVQFLARDADRMAHLASYREIDIALDPFPFTGSTTSFEALWMGVPVVTLAGERMVGRWTASMVTRLGLEALIAATAVDYVTLARTLAGDMTRLTTLRRDLRGRVARSPLCAASAKARQLERLYRAFWRRFCAAPTA